MRLRAVLAVAAAAGLLAACGPPTPSPTHSPSPSHTTASPSPSPTGSPQPPPGPITPLVPVHDPGNVTGTLSGEHCHVIATPGGGLPDPKCTPGSIDPQITAASLCPYASTRAYRPPESQTQAFKYGQAYPAYGIAAGTKTELDHLVSLELGGSNSALNLWPEVPPTPNPKDAIENALHAWVCQASGAAAQARLQQAQLAIATNWTTAEAVLHITVAGGGA